MTEAHVHSHQHPAGAAPPSGRGAGSTLALISLSHGINHAQGALMPLVYPAILREFGVGYGELGVMLGVASGVGGGMQLVAGALGTVVRRHALLGAGNLAVALCVALTATAQGFSQFFLWNVGARVASAAQHPVGSSLLAHQFSHHRLGTALAAHFSAGNLGTAVIPFVAALLISLWGWRLTTVLFALPGALIGLAIWRWLGDPRQATEAGSRHRDAGPWRGGWAVLSHPRLRWILLATMVAAGGSGHGVLSVYLPLYLNDALHLEPAAMGFIFSLFTTGSVVGPLLGGRLVDRFDRQRVVLGAYGVAAVVSFAFPWSAAQPLLLPFSALLLGTAAFGINPILQTVVAQASEGRGRDLAFALFYTSAFLASTVWSPVIGFIAQGLGLEAAFAAMAASFVLASLCLLRCRLDDAAPEPERASLSVDAA